MPLQSVIKKKQELHPVRITAQQKVIDIKDLDIYFIVHTGIPYSIHVTLTEKPHSTSKGHLVVSLIGCRCISPPLHLLPLSKPDLLPSRTEVYSVHTPDVGSVESIKVC